MKKQAGNAVDAVMDVLNGLKQSALDEREALEKSHDATEKHLERKITTLTSIRDTNHGIYDAAVAYREWVESEIVNTDDYIHYIHDRFE